MFVDPSHAAGKRDIVIPLARAGLAVGSDGLIIEAHPRPDEALVDGSQSLTVEMLHDFMESCRNSGYWQNGLEVKPGVIS